jgi:hypothetical protein
VAKISDIGIRSLARPHDRGADSTLDRPAISLKRAKENVLSLSNEIAAKHGHFRASLAGEPKLVYGQGHDMAKHGEGKPIHIDQDEVKRIRKETNDFTKKHFGYDENDKD